MRKGIILPLTFPALPSLPVQSHQAFLSCLLADHFSYLEPFLLQTNHNCQAVPVDYKRVLRMSVDTNENSICYTKFQTNINSNHWQISFQSYREAGIFLKMQLKISEKVNYTSRFTCHTPILHLFREKKHGILRVFKVEANH